ncbi:uncharacterized protein PGTG_19530 [Puccinia graminis f. sp. tritici CRL 75-36-700-3]|uniref:Uncharacterized protein n=1 Tax=Puccinia graminis f. sp. tritici (strain CRL 75-36-700-3 / race SCCL) TaxID=418459 RepID=E3LAK1_PUCGT|nr:uncharacterized protein PGTG_19530 [Puccinia graminis f. sp. tritici CRL 75-36-700-3]EFP93576.1 hypothetical protein PGTG_19530 [Puccinia graminis f. sp. tritici CRL 75-36-700-3]
MYLTPHNYCRLRPYYPGDQSGLASACKLLFRCHGRSERLGYQLHWLWYPKPEATFPLSPCSTIGLRQSSRMFLANIGHCNPVASSPLERGRVMYIGPKAICILTPGGEQPSNYWGGCCLANFAVNSSPIKQIDVPTFNANCNFASKPKN